MIRPRENRKRVQWVRREVRGLLKLGPWMLALLAITVVLWRPDLAASAGLFQSGAPTPTPEPPTATPGLTPTTEPSATVLPETPAASATVAPTTPAISPTPAMTQEMTVSPVPSATLLPTATPTDTPAPTWTPVPPTQTPFPSPTPFEEGAQDEQRYSQGDSAYRFELGMLFDSLALAASYLWLCCGVILLLGVPLLFIVLWVASRRRNQPEE